MKTRYFIEINPKITCEPRERKAWRMVEKRLEHNENIHSGIWRDSSFENPEQLRLAIKREIHEVTPEEFVLLF